MIKRVYCNQPSFNTLKDLDNGLNIVLADRHEQSTNKDSRNGTGKTTLIEILHFCFGSNKEKLDTLKKENLKEWEFGLDFSSKIGDFSVWRNLGVDHRNVQFSGLDNIVSNYLSTYPDSIKSTEDHYETKYETWNQIIGNTFYKIPEKDRKYSPSFRSLFNYAVRKKPEAFLSPFGTSAKQTPWDRQLHNLYMLGGNWKRATQLQLIKDKKKALQELKKAGSQNLLKGYSGKIGELRTKEVHLRAEVKNLQGFLERFQVHPEYANIQSEADRLTKEIHEKTDKVSLNEAYLEKYSQSLKEEKSSDKETLYSIYQEAGLVFSNASLKTLQEVEAFHGKLIENRRDYLGNEIVHLKKENVALQAEIKELDTQRAKLFGILKTHKALDEYAKMQTRLSEKATELVNTQQLIENINTIENNQLIINKERISLYEESFSEKREMQTVFDEAIELFNEYSQFLYKSPGNLTIDLTENNGYEFDVTIERSGSQGIDLMKTFCYDLMLSKLMADRGIGLGLLVHDSTMFDGVDERQVAKALELAGQVSDESNFQYIATLNSDTVPFTEMNPEFKDKFTSSVRLRLSDDSGGGGLLGIRF